MESAGGGSYLEVGRETSLIDRLNRLTLLGAGKWPFRQRTMRAFELVEP